MTAVTQTDRPNSVRNRCVKEFLVAFIGLPRHFLDFSVGEGDFVIGVSKISSFFFYVVRSITKLAFFEHASDQHVVHFR